MKNCDRRNVFVYCHKNCKLYRNNVEGVAAKRLRQSGENLTRDTPPPPQRRIATALPSPTSQTCKTVQWNEILSTQAGRFTSSHHHVSARRGSAHEQVPVRFPTQARDWRVTRLTQHSRSARRRPAEDNSTTDLLKLRQDNFHVEWSQTSLRATSVRLTR